MSSETVAHQVAQKTREMGKTEEPTKKLNHEKLSVFRGSAVMFGNLRDLQLPRRDSNNRHFSSEFGTF